MDNKNSPPPEEKNSSCKLPEIQESEANEIPLYGGVARSDRVVRNTISYMSLPYNPKLKERARALRKSGNLSESLLWQQLKNKQLNGLDFDRQKIIGNYIIDFYCPNCGVIIEIDGISHDEKIEYDQERDAFLSGLGLTVIHIHDSDVKKNLIGVIEMLNIHPALMSE